MGSLQLPHAAQNRPIKSIRRTHHRQLTDLTCTVDGLQNTHGINTLYEVQLYRHSCSIINLLLNNIGNFESYIFREQLRNGLQVYVGVICMVHWHHFYAVFIQ